MIPADQLLARSNNNNSCFQQSQQLQHSSMQVPGKQPQCMQRMRCIDRPYNWQPSHTAALLHNTTGDTHDKPHTPIIALSSAHAQGTRRITMLHNTTRDTHDKGHTAIVALSSAHAQGTRRITMLHNTTKDTHDKGHTAIVALSSAHAQGTRRLAS
jgi:hypothetical protein